METDPARAASHNNVARVSFHFQIDGSAHLECLIESPLRSGSESHAGSNQHDQRDRQKLRPRQN